VLVLRPAETAAAGDATRRVLWGTAVAGAAWLVLFALGGTAQVLVAFAVGLCVATLDLPGAALAVVVTAVAAGSGGPRVAAGAAVVVGVAAVVGAAPAAWVGRRCGGLSLPGTCLAAVPLVLAFGPVGGLAAPACAALIRLLSPSARA
jgi:hypothetical protein